MSEISNVERQLIINLDSRFDDFGERLARVEGRLENKPEKSFYEKLGTRGGIIALVISIFTGSFAIYEKFVVDPQKAAHQQRLQVRTTLDEITQIQAAIAKTTAENPAAGNSIADSFSSKMRSLISRSHRNYLKFEDAFEFADHLMLGNLLFNFGHVDKAFIHAEASAELAGDHIQEANSFWFKANLFSAIGDNQDLSQMRKMFESAIDVSKQKNLQTSIGTTFDIYLDWLRAELNVGDCVIAKNVMYKLSIDMKLDAVFPQTRNRVGNNVRNVIRNAKRDCGLPKLDQ